MRHALRYALENDLPEQVGHAYSFVSDACFLYDRYGEALEVQREALALARRVGIRRAETFALAELSYALAMTGRWDEALSARMELPDDLLRTSPNVSSVLSGVVEIHLHRGDTDAARELLSLCDYLEDSFELQDRAIYLGARAALLSIEGDHEGALASGLAAFELADTLGLGQQAVKQGFVWAVEAALALGDTERADRLLTFVEKRPLGLRPPFVEAQAHRFRAGMSGDDTGLKVAAASFREHNFPFWLAVTELERAEWLVAEGRTDEAQTPLDEAREIFERLEAKPWLERLDRVESREPSEVAS
jgi:tetratricopeptide (TPR) repeat protein